MKINEKIFDKMEKKYLNQEENEYTTNLASLNLPDEIKLKEFKNDVNNKKIILKNKIDFLKFLDILLDNENTDYIKFGLYLIKINLKMNKYNIQSMKFDPFLIIKICKILQNNKFDKNLLVRNFL